MKQKKVAILTYDKLALFELGCAVELFALPRPEIKNWYQCEVITFNQSPMNATGNIKIQAKLVESLNSYNMLIIPSWPVKQSQVPQTLKQEIQSFHQRGGRLVSFCSGAFLLAELGLLNNKRATTHWRYAELFKQKYPLVKYVDDILYLYQGQIGCSAGSSAAIDLGLQVIREDFGYEICNQVARRLVLSPHRDGGQSQFVETPIEKRPNKFATTLDWAVDNLTACLSVSDLAAKANMSRRTFDRKFRAALNLSPKEWLTLQRLNLAKSLLETGNDSIELVAIQSGFENVLTLRHNFRKHLKLSPSQYRSQFGR